LDRKFRFLRQDLLAQSIRKKRNRRRSNCPRPPRIRPAQSNAGLEWVSLGSALTSPESTTRRRAGVAAECPSSQSRLSLPEDQFARLAVLADTGETSSRWPRCGVVSPRTSQEPICLDPSTTGRTLLCNRKERNPLIGRDAAEIDGLCGFRLSSGRSHRLGPRESARC